MGLTSMISLHGRALLAIAGFAALVLATGYSAMSPRLPEQAVAAPPQLPLRAIYAETLWPVQLAELEKSPMSVEPLYRDEPLADAPVADMKPALLRDVPEEPAAVPQVDVVRLIKAAFAQRARTTDAESLCLAEAVFFEARGESLEGQLAVAQVILNRVKDKRFANTICGVVQERSPGPSRTCQFSFVCDAHSDVPPPSRAWQVAQAVAVVALDENTQDISEGALFFHASHVSPKWRHRLNYTRTVGTHLFYR